MGVPGGEQQHCALVQQGQWGVPHCGLRGGQWDGRVHDGQMAGPLHVGLHGQKNVFECEPLCGLSESPGELRGQLGELRELLGEVHEQVVLDGQGWQEHCDGLGGLPQGLHDGGHCGDVRQGAGQGRVA